MIPTLYMLGVLLACGTALAGLPNLLAAAGLLLLRASRGLRAMHDQIERNIDKNTARLLQW